MTTIDVPRDTASRTPARVRTGQGLLTLVLVLMAAVGLSTAFVADSYPHGAVVLIASYAAVAAVLGVALVWSATRSRIARLALWVVPFFFVSHVAALGTWLPDAVLAVVAAVGVLLVGSGRPRA